LIDAIKPKIVDIAMNVHGTRAIQTLVEVLSKNLETLEPELMSIIEEMKP